MSELKNGCLAELVPTNPSKNEHIVGRIVEVIKLYAGFSERDGGPLAYIRFASSTFVNADGEWSYETEGYVAHVNLKPIDPDEILRITEREKEKETA